MPIKLPKSFARRKSSGNILDEVDSNTQPSFRVFERPGANRSMTDSASLTKRMSEGNLVPSMLEDSDNIFAGTEQPLDKSRYDRPRLMDSLRKRLTSHRLSGATYESSNSTRLSSSSTLPSSTEIPPPDDSLSPHSRIQDIPIPPPLSGALRAAGRTFSFGGRFKTSTPPAPPRHATPDTATRQRALTGGTDSTATPPKLPDSNFDLGTGGDDFGRMFDHVGKRESALLREPTPHQTQQYSSSPPTQALSEFQMDGRAARPAPISTDRSAEVEPSPYSWDSRHSEEGLLSEPDSGLGPNKSSSPQFPPETITGFRRPSPGPNQMMGATTSHRALERPRRQSDQGLRRSRIYSGGPDFSPIDDEDAKLVRQSLLWSKESSSPPQWAEGVFPSNGTTLSDKGKAASLSEHFTSEPESLFANRYSSDPTDNVDSSIADHARLAVQFAENVPRTTSPGNKVMTPSQFEHYRQQQELRRSNSNATSDDESVNDDFDEEDEAEKQREAERQRRKQEAHMSVYRQQMMKVTGQQAASPLLHPTMTGASSSTPNLPNRLSNPGDKSSSGKSSEEDDEEVPLGILAAHGFPNRNRPPNRLANTNSNPNLRASMLHPYASSASSLAGAEHENRNSLPVFARNLPRDPYFGASLVNPSNRESLAMGGGSVYGDSSSPVPPGGLVGVIASEERARAMRRGSPNTQTMYEMGGVPRPYSMMPPPPPAQQPQISPSEQAQVQLSQQMASMMQMQMQWMQQMMQIQGMQGTPPPMMKGGMQPNPMMGGSPMPGAPMGTPSLMVPTMAGPPSVVGGNVRPVSMSGSAPVPLNFDPHALGALDPTIAMRRTGSPMPNMPGGAFRPNTASYAPSLAPSERSNAGLASRYRPVSLMPGELGHAAPSTLNKVWNDENHNPSLSAPRTHGQIPKPSTFATVTVRPVSRASQSSPGGPKPQRGGSDDEDDEEAWAEMMKKRDKKKNNWKLKRGTSSFGDLLSAVH
ncbi:uncharacterized protein N7459_006816 [Penicillium hispanicum]|uniref:uncharacterized protein n=1 Tax=Penicillium hispanicum TaxID=1080232 RepID=UPI00254029FE|nr:uncharacterized protein N7459_006816 [Penicillium hispanicum]KAJ5577852.1 hypothetical protein N7459_006816 [Penicillium hispanicum]